MHASQGLLVIVCLVRGWCFTGSLVLGGGFLLVFAKKMAVVIFRSGVLYVE